MRAQKGRQFPRESICIDEMAHNEHDWEIKLVETLSIVGVDPYLEKAIKEEKILFRNEFFADSE